MHTTAIVFLGEQPFAHYRQSGMNRVRRSPRLPRTRSAVRNAALAATCVGIALFCFLFFFSPNKAINGTEVSQERPISRSQSEINGEVTSTLEAGGGGGAAEHNSAGEEEKLDGGKEEGVKADANEEDGTTSTEAAVSSESTASTDAAASTGAAAHSQCPPLSQELLQQHAKGNTVMLGLMWSAQQDFGLNWLRHVQSLGLTYYVLGALDRNTSALLAGMQVPCFYYEDEAVAELTNAKSGLNWGEEGWRLLSWAKVLLVNKVVDWGFNVIVSDMDVVWLRDPLPLLEKHPHADVIFSHDWDGTGNNPGDDGLEELADMHWTFNTGVYLLRNTPNATAWVHAWRAKFPAFPGHDQYAAHELTRQGRVERHPLDPRVSTGFNESLYLGFLAASAFGSGHTHVVQRLHERLTTQPYGVHFTWTYNGAGGKRARTRDAGLWLDDEAYYGGPSFVTVDLQVPPMPEGFNNWTESEPMITHHLETIQTELQQAYIGMALAIASGRSFISPKFECRCDRAWYPVTRCRMLGSQDLQFPITCPTDYLFNPDNFQDDPAEFGTPLDFREPSFLENPRTPAEVKDSVLEVRPSSSLACNSCSEEKQGEDGNLVVLVPPGLKDKHLLPLLEPYHKYRVWRLSFMGLEKPSQAFGGFSCAGAAKEFDKRMGHITAEWCCRPEEEAKKYNKTERISEQLHMAADSDLFSAQEGLDPSC